MKILLIRLSSIGDIVLATSVLKPLRDKFPKSEISMVVLSPYSSLLQENPYLTKIIDFEVGHTFLSDLYSLFRFIRFLRREKFDLIIDLHRNLRSILITLFSGSQKRIRYQKAVLKRRMLVLFKKRKIKAGFVHTVHRYLAALEPLDISPNHAAPELFLKEEEKKKAERIVNSEFKMKNSEFTDHNSPFTILVGMIPGARHATKRWNPSGFAALGMRLRRELNAGIILLGDGGDQDAARTIEEEMDEDVFNLVGKTSLRELVLILDRCGIIISNDSGPLHMARGLGKPVVALFGPTVEEFGFSPYDVGGTSLPDRPPADEAGQAGQSLTLSKELPCRPCSLHGSARCPLVHHNCMNLIKFDEVFEAVKLLIKR
jgi:heptosyltransferase-2